MKRYVLLGLTLFLLLCAVYAQADTRGLTDGVLPVNAAAEWKPNFDGTHSNASGATAVCSYELLMVGETSMTVCPVCGEMNGTEIIPVLGGRYLQVHRLDETEVKTYTGLTCLNGDYIVRMKVMPAECEIACIVTFCHELAGVAVNADAIYSLVIPLDMTGLTPVRAYFGGTQPIGRVEQQDDGVHIIPENTQKTFGLYAFLR